MRLAVVGAGLMGSSFALAARRRALVQHVVAVEPDGARGRRAVELGVVDAVAQRVPDDADAVLLAGPSHSVAPWVVELADHPGVVFDLASVKAGVLDAIRARVGAVPARFVPCHPLAGSERTGPEAADPELFHGNAVIVTPVAETDPTALDRVSGWWRALGARVQAMPPARHDEILAVTSHLPHLLAFAYLGGVADEHLEHAAGGFRDFTRIGAADAQMWASIFTLNQSAVLAALDDFEGQLARLRTLVEAGDLEALEPLLEAAAARRRSFPHDG